MIVANLRVWLVCGWFGLCVCVQGGGVDGGDGGEGEGRGILSGILVSKRSVLS